MEQNPTVLVLGLLAIVGAALAALFSARRGGAETQRLKDENANLKEYIEVEEASNERANEAAAVRTGDVVSDSLSDVPPIPDKWLRD